MKNHDQWLESITPEAGWYITGFADGEGSFNVSLRRRTDHRLGWDIDPSFNISQRDRVILAWIKQIFGCGTLRERADGVVYFEVRNVGMLRERVIPFFRRYRFRSAAKKKNFALFAQIISCLGHGPATPAILREVVMIRERLNEGRGRKRLYNASDVLKEESSETIR